MTTNPQEARHVRCQRCGAGFPVLVIAPSIACPYCGNVQPMPPEIAQQLAQYQHEMASRATSVQALDRASAQALRADAEGGAIWSRGSWVGYVVFEDERKRFEQLVAHPEQALGMAEILGALVRVTVMSGGRPAQAVPG